jgi:sterol desaturase/sphingolipid hydroxylase (fatty acid hydroxylase superfamily)
LQSIAPIKGKFVLGDLSALVYDAGVSLFEAIQILILSALIFTWLALAVNGRAAIAAAQRVRKELPTNLHLFVLDALMVAPIIALVVSVIRMSISGSPLELVDPQQWSRVPTAVTLFLVVFTGDFISFMRHRLEHTRLLWPAHAVHHSDTEMTWLTIVRFHPINRLTTMVTDTAGLAILGFPEWALIGNVLVRHYYGEFIHANLPWTYGPLGRVFVSPVMHRWHHARDVRGAGSNFATVFSVFDQLCGTYYVPGLCTVPLGVNDDMGRGVSGQLLYPFVAWRRRWVRRRSKRPLESSLNPTVTEGL